MQIAERVTQRLPDYTKFNGNYEILSKWESKLTTAHHWMAYEYNNVYHKCSTCSILKHLYYCVSSLH